MRASPTRIRDVQSKVLASGLAGLSAIVLLGCTGDSGAAGTTGKGSGAHPGACATGSTLTNPGGGGTTQVFGGVAGGAGNGVSGADCVAGGPVSNTIAPGDLMPKAGCWSYGKTIDPGNQGPQGTTHKAASLTGPIPVNHWWTPFYWHMDPSQPRSFAGIYPLPLAGSVVPTGLTFEYLPKAINSDLEYWYRLLPIDLKSPDKGRSQHDLLVTVEGMTGVEPVLSGFSDWAATEQWSDGTHDLKATLVEGGPFAFLEIKGGAAVVRFNDGRGPYQAKAQGSTLAVTAPGDRYYGIYAPGGSTWTVAADGLSATSTLAGKDYLSVAALPTADALDYFRKRAYNFISGSSATWGYDGAASQVVTRFQVTTVAKETGGDLSPLPLLGLFPHQWKHSQDQLTTHAFASGRGPVKILEGDSFTTSLTYHGILPFMPVTDGADPAKLKDYLAKPLIYTPLDGDTYYSAGAIATIAEQAILQDLVGNSSQRDEGLSRAKNALNNWFTHTRSDVPAAAPGAASFQYSPEWSTVIGYKPDFGSELFGNDHHYHWGYLIHAAALAALYDPGWASDAGYGGMVKILVRDADNPLRTDGEFPFMRYFDAYAGHSWSSGSCNFLEGCNQESVSEALNFASALILWGEATGNPTLRDLGIYLYTTEADAFESYWFNADGDAFPAGFAHAGIANVWGAGGKYATWWGDQPTPTDIFMIEILPVTGRSLYLGLRPDALQKNYQHMQDMWKVHPPKDPKSWIDILLEGQSLYDADAATASLGQLGGSYTQSWNDSFARSYTFTSALKTLGPVDASTTANVPIFAVFKQGELRTYSAFNAHCTGSILPKFSDGTTFEVPPRSLVLFQSGKVLQSITLGGSPDCSAPAPACP